MSAKDKNITDYMQGFNKIIQKMNITKKELSEAAQDIFFDSESAQQYQMLITTGINIEGYLSEMPDVMKFGTNELFVFMQRPTFVYIKEHIVKLNSSGKEERKPPVVHLCYCDNLKKADEEGRLKSRYVMTQRSTGFFEIIKKEWDNFDNILFAGDEKLRVCQSCLHRLNWNQFRRFCLPKEEWWKDDNKYRKSNREKIANNFNFESYVKFAKNRMGSKYDFSKKNLPKYHAANALEYKYSLTPKMKYELKKSVWFKCQICNANFDSRFLEIHHIDRNPAHNNIENLQVLCRRCHSRITNG